MENHDEHKAELKKESAALMLKKLKGVSEQLDKLDMDDIQSITISLVMKGNKMKCGESYHDEKKEESDVGEASEE